MKDRTTHNLYQIIQIKKLDINKLTFSNSIEHKPNINFILFYISLLCKF